MTAPSGRYKYTVPATCLFLFFFFLILCACNGGGGEEATSSATPGEQPGPETSTTLKTRNEIEALITGTKHYLDALSGNDTTGDGTSAKPWRTLAKAQAALKAGDGVILRNGNYGAFTFDTAYEDWVIYINEEGTTPEFTHISLYGSQTSNPPQLHLIFWGIIIAPEPVLQTVDPQYSDSTLSTYNKTAYPVYIRNNSFVGFYHCEMMGINKHLTGGIYLSNTSNIVVERCRIHRTEGGITYINANNISMKYNYLDEIASSFFRDGGNCSDILIEGNHAHNSNWIYAEDWCPRKEGQTYHGSLVAIRSPQTTVRNNILHDGGNSSGIMFYDGTNRPYSDVLIENNLIYDAHNSTTLVVGHTGDNVVIRNNIVIGRGRYGNTSQYKYNLAMSINAPYDGYDASGISVYNNIFVGGVVFTDLSRTKESHNIYWSALHNSNWLTQSSFPTSKIVYGSETDDYFDTGFFADDVNRSWLYWDISSETWYQYTLNAPGHGTTLNLVPRADSDAVNFGDSARQPSSSLGSLDASSQFIIPDGRTRNSSRHSAGCYELP